MRASCLYAVAGAACVLALAMPHARAACATPAGSGAIRSSVVTRWRLDHYAYDASLHRNWAVLIDCEHPASPARMELVPGRVHEPDTQRTAPERGGKSAPAGEPAETQLAIRFAVQPEIRVGEAVQVLNRAGAPASFLLAGRAEESAVIGRPIRVRLNATGAQVRAIVRGPHSVELAAAVKPVWRKP